MSPDPVSPKALRRKLKGLVTSRNSSRFALLLIALNLVAIYILSYKSRTHLAPPLRTGALRLDIEGDPTRRIPWSQFSTAEVGRFTETIGGVLFLGRTYEGSSLVRCIELGDGLRIFTGLRTECRTFEEFFQADEASLHGKYDFIIFTKFWEYKYILVKANRLARFVLFDTVDNFDGYPTNVDAIIVNTRAQRDWFEYVNVNSPVFVLPHHVGNHNGFSVPSVRRRSKVLLDPRTPLPAIMGVRSAARKHGIEVQFGKREWNESRASKETAFSRSLAYSLETADYDLAALWVGYTGINACFKPGHRLANALALGLPTITDLSAGFTDTLDDAGILHDYELIAGNASEVGHMAVELMRDDRLWSRSAELARKVQPAFSLQAISWSLFDILYSLAEGDVRAHARKVRKPSLSTKCDPAEIAGHYAKENGFHAFTEIAVGEKVRKAIIASVTHKS